MHRIPAIIETLDRDLYEVVDGVGEDEYRPLLEQLGDLIPYERPVEETMFSSTYDQSLSFSASTVL